MGLWSSGTTPPSHGGDSRFDSSQAHLESNVIFSTMKTYSIGGGVRRNFVPLIRSSQAH